MILRTIINYVKKNPQYRLHPPPRTSHPRRRRQGPLLPGGLVVVVVVHRRHRHRPPPPPSSPSWVMGLVVVCCLVPPAATDILTIVIHRRRKSTNDGVPAASPRPLPPPATPPSPSPSRTPALSIAHGVVMDRHVASTPSRSDAASAAPACASLVGGRAHCANAAVTAAAMPRSPLRRPAVAPPSLLGPPPPVGRRQLQHGDVDARPWRGLRFCDHDARLSRSSPLCLWDV